MIPDMARKDTQNGIKQFNIYVNLWIYGKLKMWADENGMSVRAAVRYIINQFFKSRP